MADAGSLRNLLARVDISGPAIQGSAAQMMKHYDRSPGVAVVEWRNALHNSQREQWLPLLYVANEVLQNSKRNRGNKFLEAFSPILGQSLIFVCQHSDAPMVEKIRRVVKIWGDRRVFSVRYVNELLKGLEPYRNNRGASQAPIVQPNNHNNNNHQPVPSHHSTTTTTTAPATTTHHTSHAQAATPSSKEEDETEQNQDNNNKEDDDSDDPMDILNDDNDENDDDDDDDDDDNIFGESDSGSALKINVELNFDSTAMQSPTSAHGTAIKNRQKLKRRRSSTASSGSQNSASKRARRRSVLSTTSLVELWKGVADLDTTFDRSVAILKDITLPETQELENLVGDELLDNHKLILKYQDRVSQQRDTLYRIATERRTLEQDAVRYIPWLEAALQQDVEDLKFCETLETALVKLQHVHPAIREARDKRVAEDLRFQREQEEKERQRKEEEDAKKFRESALSKETEAKPGMVWNKVTQEYQYLNTDESWRD